MKTPRACWSTIDCLSCLSRTTGQQPHIASCGNQRLTAIMAFSTFSASPGFADGPFALIPCSFCSFCWIFRSSCGILSFAKRSRRSNMSRMLTKLSRIVLRSSRRPSSQARASSSCRAWEVLSCFAVPLMPSFSKGTSLVSMAYASALVSVTEVRFRLNRPYSLAMASLRLQSRSTRLHRLI